MCILSKPHGSFINCMVISTRLPLQKYGCTLWQGLPKQYDSLCIFLQSDRRQTFSAIVRFTSYFRLWVVKKGSSQKLSFLLQTPSFRPAALGHPTVVAFFLWIDWLMFWCLLFGSQSLINAVVSDIPLHSHILVAQHVKCHLVCMSASPPPQRQFRWYTGVGSPILCPQQAITKHTRNSAGPSWGVLFWSHDWCEIGLFVSQYCNHAFCWSSAGRGRCVEMRQAAEKWWFFLQLSARAALTIDLLRLFVEMSDTKSEHLEVKHRSSRPVFISLRMHYPCSGFSIFLDSWTSTLVKQSRFHDMTDESRFITLKRPVPSPGFQA